MSNRYVFSYKHNGNESTFSLNAEDTNDAISRLNSVKNNSELIGKSIGQIKIPQKGWFGKAVFFTVFGFFLCFITIGG